MFAAKTITKPEEIFLLRNCRRLSGRLTSGEAAVVLNFQEHDIATLLTAKMLRALGDPAQNAPKYFASVDILARAADPEWLSKATKAVAKHWKAKNSRKSKATGNHNPTAK